MLYDGVDIENADKDAMVACNAPLTVSKRAKTLPLPFTLMEPN